MERFSGGTWTVQRAPNGLLANANTGGGWAGSSLASVSCTSTTGCEAVGTVSYNCAGCPQGDTDEFGLTELWNGSTWTVQPNPTGNPDTGGSLGAVSCGTGSSCVALPGPLRWNGAHWTVQQSPGPPTEFNSGLSDVSCPSATMCWAVGGYGLSEDAPDVAWAQRWNGVQWANVEAADTPVTTTAELMGVSCTSLRNCTAVGHFLDTRGVQATLAERWDGFRLVTQAAPNQAAGFEAQNLLDGVSCTSSRFCMAVGWFAGGNSTANGGTLAEEWNGHRWRIISTPVHPNVHTFDTDGARFFAVSCTTPSACMAVGTDGGATLSERWNGSRWTVEYTPNPTGQFSELDGVACPQTTSCVAVGRGAEVWNGSTWTVVPVPTFQGNVGLDAVSCSTTAMCTAVGPNQLAEDWNGTRWTQTSPPPPAIGFLPELKGVSCVAASTCVAVGTLEQLTGGALTSAYLWDGMSWAPQATRTPVGSGQLEAVACTSPTHCIAVGALYDGINGAYNTAALAEQYS